jgi:AcrR family transcriptional regulator
MARSPGGYRGAAAAPPGRDAILEAFLVLLGEKPFDSISLIEVAKKAGVSLADLRASFGSTFDMVSAFIRETDRKVLAVEAQDMEDQSPRDRLFDVLMRRLDALAPHKAAVRSLGDSARRSPMFALALNRLAVRSQQWMLAAAKIDVAGLRGAVRAQGLAVLFSHVLTVWLRDEDPGLARTMAALDRELDKGERALGLMHNVCRLATCGGRRRRSRHESTPSPEPDAPLAA